MQTHNGPTKKPHWSGPGQHNPIEFVGSTQQRLPHQIPAQPPPELELLAEELALLDELAAEELALLDELAAEELALLEALELLEAVALLASLLLVDATLELVLPPWAPPAPPAPPAPVSWMAESLPDAHPAIVRARHSERALRTATTTISPS